VRLYRVTKNDPPTPDDMKSHWDVGKRPSRKQDEDAYKEVSTFETAEAAAAKARARNLGDYIAELEVPDQAIRSRARSGHVGLYGMTPEELLGCIQSILRVDDV
jgi:hypothetical protein